MVRKKHLENGKDSCQTAKSHGLLRNRSHKTRPYQQAIQCALGPILLSARHYATSQKVAGSKADELAELFQFT
jgi:hypothetical protein